MIESKLHPIVQQAKDFTEVYKKHINDHPAVREAACLKAQYPALVGPIRDDDLFAGAKASDRITFLGLIWWAVMPSGNGHGKQGGYCFDFGALERYGDNPADRAVLEDLTEFWRKESTTSKIMDRWDDDMNTYIGTDNIILGGGCGMCIAPNIDNLVQKGIPGLYADIDKRLADNDPDADPDFLKSLRVSVDILVDMCRHYADEARKLAENPKDDKDKKRLLDIADTLEANIEYAPRDLREAIQLIWIYSVTASGKHIDAWRPDVALGDLYVKDIEEGNLTEEEAVELVLGLWRKFTHEGDPAVCRVLVGGKGRRNEDNADRFALAAIEATRRHKQVTPQLTLRFYEGQNPALMSKAFDSLGEGCIYPMLYNDDVNIPGIMAALDVSEEEAYLYHPLGCGEFMLAQCSPSMLNHVINVPRAVEAALRNGMNMDGKKISIQTGDPHEFKTYNDLNEAYLKQIDFAMDYPAKTHSLNAEYLKEDMAYLFASLCTDDCIERGRSMVDGGVRYVGACAMGQGYTNASDSLVAIKKLVFEEKKYTLDQVLEALDADFAGFEQIHKDMRNCPKFGNDDEEADRIYVDSWKAINTSIAKAGKKHGLHFLTASSVNPGGYFTGNMSGATADGRHAHKPFAIGHAPTAGNDKRGITAFLNSAAKMDPANGGAATNIKINRDYFTKSRKKLEAIFRTFWKQGGLQAMITVVNQKDLEAAMKEPEKYPHLLVRVGGWAARFIDLERDVQEDILKRTEY